MVALNQIVRFLNKELAIRSIKDSSRNGLQAKGKSDVKKIAVGVDACLELFEKAKQKNCELVIVHHGLIWKGKKEREPLTKIRIGYLKKNRMSLYACHLPLDKHATLGNNAQLTKLLSLKNVKSFAKYHGVNIGFFGNLRTNIQDLSWQLEHSLRTKCTVHAFGPKMTRKIGIVSGGAADMIFECKRLGIDTYITGETRHSYYHAAKELRMNVIYAGHYKTETAGVIAVGEFLKQKFNIETVFIDAPTNL
jgi:dinuclear metal center YbgI/SA1388 family protein